MLAQTRHTYPSVIKVREIPGGSDGEGNIKYALARGVSVHFKGWSILENYSKAADVTL
jgi:hypothetical protein